MNKKERVDFWIKSAKEAKEVMLWLYKGKRYSDALFYGQLMLEKLLKAVYISKFNKSPPFVHDLLFLAKKSKLEVTVDLSKDLEIITGFNINARYDDYKESFRTTATKEYTIAFFEIIEEIELWLKDMI